MFREILVPLDGSWVSERIVSDARLLADATDGRLTFVHVLPLGSGPLMEVEHGMSRVDARAYLGGFVEEMGQAGYRARAVVLRGDPAEQIASYAASEGIDVIAMTTHGRGGLGRVLLGSVADAVVRSAPVPVLLRRVQDEDETQDLTLPKRILVPLDGSDLAEAILPYAVELARLSHGSLLLLRVLEDVERLARELETSGERNDPEYPDIIWRRLEQEAKAYLDGVAHRFESTAVTITSRVRFGEPVMAIRTQVIDANIDLIALATHGRSGLTRLALGSVATALLQRSTRLMLVLCGTALSQATRAEATPSAVPAPK